MTAQEILKELEQYGDPNTKKTLMRHGAKEPFFGVKVQDLKTILKKTKKNHELSLALYATGNSDAMYLAGLMADETRITEAQLEDWVRQAYWYYLSEYTVPWVAAETKFGFKIGQKWIASPDETIAAAGWSTLAYYASVNDDADLEIEAYRNLLDRIGIEIHSCPNRVRHTMNSFVINIACYIPTLTQKAKEVAQRIGEVTVDMGGTACKEPLATAYIEKAEKAGRLGKKRKTARC